MTARGLRNFNPGNIDRDGHTKWQGMADDQSSDPRFVVFKAPEWGIRAIARLMLTYQSQYGCDTVRKLINRWAPPVENNTGAYVAVVTAACAVGADDPIDVDTAEVMNPLVKAIIVHENGQNPYPDSLIAEAVHMAGVADAKPKPLVKQNTFVAQAGSGVAIAGAAAVQAVAHAGSTAATYAPAVKGAADQLSAFSGSPLIQHVITTLLTVAGGLAMAGIAAAWLKQRKA